METSIVHIECSIHHCLLQGQELEIVADAVYLVKQNAKDEKKKKKMLHLHQSSSINSDRVTKNGFHLDNCTIVFDSKQAQCLPLLYLLCDLVYTKVAFQRVGFDRVKFHVISH